ncbi:deoxyribodipyrimidine photolyase [Croceicoccus estronivorus]|uniref:cryptochrome/photolyase family protein n=1 Tax=Croceicoccus estronivorus TaxID=1172626 RepID=UPI00083359D3|nr:deoxyribodipyrimidine photo-lyase [Croceicoccus estronivorus]OCC23131.1 deoxyribodipyrimidine photolyase [Croceicoccus estronivorus]
MSRPQIVWLRRDLRLADQPAFQAAGSAGPVIPVYVLDDERPGSRQMGGASRWWLHRSLAAMDAELRRHDARLILRKGDVVDQLVRLMDETGAACVHAVRHYEPWWIKAEADLAKRVSLRLYDGNYLVPPGRLKTGGGTAFKIFTPFYKALLNDGGPRSPVAEGNLAFADAWPESDWLDDWKLLPSSPDWAGGLRQAWQCGEAAAQAQLADFHDRAKDYEEARNLPSVEGSSRLSPHLHFGEISPAQAWHALEGMRGEGIESFRRELVWRDYAQNLVWQRPDYPERPYRPEFEGFPWRDPKGDDRAAADLLAWKAGQTGYPIVDAGMRQLWQTGWMHNRVRMIAASFLIKHLLIDWREGERWFWDTLVDADYGNNGANWQWVAGSGADANMFVRIMAPLSQSSKFEAADYIRRWVPELASLGDAVIHDPESRPSGYPPRLIGHREARERALAAWQVVKSS